MSNYDSTNDTLIHIKRVNELLNNAAIELIKRANVHDNSKLKSPEKEVFDEYTPLLKDSTYGSENYNKFFTLLKTALDHHYSVNSHHPEYYKNGVNGMDLFDLMEMFFDWKAATERHADGDIFKSIEINKTRFNLSEQICDIFKNTVNRLDSKSLTKEDIESLGFVVKITDNGEDTNEDELDIYDGNTVIGTFFPDITTHDSNLFIFDIFFNVANKQDCETLFKQLGFL
jgi:hypothetical protein